MEDPQNEIPPRKRQKCGERTKLTTTLRQPKVSAPQAHILQLDDVCLSRIFNLIALQERSQLAQVCQRFRRVLLQPQYHKYYNKLSLYDIVSWTLEELNAFLQLAGPYVEVVCGPLSHKFGKKIAECIGRHCTQIRELTMHGINTEQLENLLRNSKTVSKLELRWSTVTDRGIACLRHLPQLQKLRIQASAKLTGKHFDKLTTLQWLILEQCDKFTPQALLATCTKLVQLKKLEIRSCKLLSMGSALNEALNQCAHLNWLALSSGKGVVLKTPQLKVLEMHSAIYANLIKPLNKCFFSNLVQYLGEQLTVLRLYTFYQNNDVIVQIAKLKQLRQLHLLGGKILDDKYLQRLAGLEYLEILEIPYCTAITTNGVLHLLRNCANLKYLSVANSKNIREDFIFEAITVLRERVEGEQRMQPLWVNAASTSVRAGIVVDDPRYLEASAILRLYVPGLTTPEEFNLHNSIYDIV